MTARKSIIKDQSGAIIITFAVMVNVLILAIALSMDLGRAYMASSAISGATDAAAVASSVNGGDEQKAKDYFLSNLPVGTLGIDFNYDTDVTHSVDPNNNTVSVSTDNFEVPAFFSAGTNTNSAVSLGGGAVVGLAGEAFLPADYFFIIDSSGSMDGDSGSGNKKREAVDVAINNFLDIVFANQGIGADGIANYRVSLTNYGTSYKDSHPLEDDKATILTQLAPMVAYHPDGTCGGCGVERSKERLQDDATNTNTHSRLRVYIFMTDGMLNQIVGSGFNGNFPADYTGETARIVGGVTEDPSQPHAFAANECLEIKTMPDQNVSFWSVRFGAGANSGINFDTMEYCASDSSQNKFAQTGNDLDDIFSQIGLATSRIRILE